MVALLKITDDTETIDMLSLPGFQLESWNPQVAGYKGGGTFQSSPLAPGRQLVNKQFDNVIETFSFKAQELSQDAIIQDVQDLVRLLEKATDYWATDWQDESVWIEARAKCETNTRYGHIVNYRIPELENPYNQPFLQPQGMSVMDTLTLVIEHTAWTENKPGVGTSVAISAVETYDGRNLGNVDGSGDRDATTDNEVFIGNQKSVANITDIYVDDGGVFSANLMDAALPYNLLPVVPAANDAVYFGIDTTLANSGPFHNLVFDIGVAGAGYTGVWQQWTGAVWSNAAVQDNTNASGAGTGIAFDTTGVNSVSFVNNSAWATRAVNGITGYWVRYLVQTVPGALTAPTQQNRDIYSAVWPYVEILSDAVGGDIPAIATIKIIQQGDGTDLGGNTNYTNRVICGLRSYDRGANFTAFLNASDEQNPSGVSVAVGGSTAFSTHTGQPTGRIALYNPGAVQAMADRVTFTLDDTISQDFYGTFHAFMTGHTTGSGASLNYIRVRLRVRSGDGNIEVYSETRDFTEGSPLTSVLSANLIDFGKITIPSNNISANETVGQIELAIQAENTSISSLIDAYIIELILIPVDEFAFDSDDSQNDSDSTISRGRYLFVDSIQRPKSYNRSLVREFSSDDIIAVYPLITNNRIISQSNARQRLWFLTAYHASYGTSPIRAPCSQMHSVLVSRNQQYITMRGAR